MMKKLKHNTLQKFLEEIIKELQDYNQNRKKMKLSEIDIPSVIAPLYDSLSSGNINDFSDFINDLEKCTTCSPIIPEYRSIVDEKNITLLLNMQKVYSNLGDAYSPLNYKYELCFYIDTSDSRNRNNNKEKFYCFLLRKVSYITSGVYLEDEEVYKKFRNNFYLFEQ